MLAILDVWIRQKEREVDAYNKKLKLKVFSIGQYVWKVIFPMDRRDRTIGKWSPNWEDIFLVIQAFSNTSYGIKELAVDKWVLRVNAKYLKRYKPMLQEIQITKEKYAVGKQKRQNGIKGCQHGIVITKMSKARKIREMWFKLEILIWIPQVWFLRS